MNLLKYIWFNILMTLLRIMPFPCQTGLIKIGNPDRESPVLLTGNFCLTVARVKRAIKGIDAYLLVANSRGINVWCAATGGMLTNHDVISVLKTSAATCGHRYRRAGSAATNQLAGSLGSSRSSRYPPVCTSEDAKKS